MAPHNQPSGSKSELEDVPPKPRNPLPKTESLQNIAESSNQPDRSLTRSPQSTTLSSLPENEVSTQPPAPVTVTDFAHPNRQYTDSTTSTSENSYIPTSNRSSLANPFNQTLHSQSSLDHQLQATQQVTQFQSTIFNNLKLNLRNVPSPHQDQRPRMPVDKDLQDVRELQQGLDWCIRTYNDEATRDNITKVVLVLHDSGSIESSFKGLVKKHLAHPETAFIFLGGIHRTHGVPVSHSNGWADDPDGNTYHRAVDLVLQHVISKVLIEKCNFAPCNIAILGHRRGGATALAIGAVWETTRLGGIITIDGPPPDYITRPTTAQNPTPVLILGARLGAITPQLEQRIKDIFLYVDTELRPDMTELELGSLSNSEEVELLKDFLAHSLRREEWETQAVMTFDGGGVRGYGSLLILKELMRRIGLEEKRLDSRTESSFSPGVYKPTIQELNNDARPITASSQQKPIVPSSTEGLDEGDLFLPCHYFTYIGGTSTGGLISIMISRFRMTVNDSIKEYKTLGGKVFAHPRPLSKGGLLWHRFSWKNLHDVIQDVTNRHCFNGRGFGVRFPSDPDLCRTIVLAYSEIGTTDAPYLFRTYETFPRHQQNDPPQPRALRRPTTLALKNAPIRNPGHPADVEISLVGRATSAAPTYFPPVRIPITDNGGERRVRFKDGGFGSNNPSAEIYHDVVHKHGGFSKNVSTFISIGTGDSELKVFAQEGWTHVATRCREAWATLKAATRLPAKTRGAHDAMLGYAVRDHRVVFNYERFDGSRRLGKIHMAEWKSNRFANLTGHETFSGAKTLREIEESVAIYLANPKVQADLDHQARLLVRRRRLRTRDKSRWDRYASGSWYECPYNCRDAAVCKTYTAFKEHVHNEHFDKYNSEPFDSIAQSSRRCWTYRST